jgi:ATP-dependent RNA helicase RhlB
VPRERQFLVFSATLNFDVLNVAYEFGADPVEVSISRDQAKAENVKDQIFHVGQDEKAAYLLSILKKYEPRQAIIFSNFKRNVERLAQFLTKNGMPAMGISSLLTQAQRNRVMEQFKADNDRNILIATDLAARGLDILGVDMVINYELPDDPENYVHRIGRTGRAGREGTAFSFVSDRDVEALSRIETYVKNKLASGWLEDQDIVKDFAPFPREEDRPRGNGGPRSFGNGGSRGGRPQQRQDRDRRPPRRDNDRDRDRRPDRDRHPERSEGSRRNQQQQHAGGQQQGSGAHRDRRTGRHGQQQNQQNRNSNQRHDGRRPQHSNQARHQQGNGQRRHQHGQRPQQKVAAAANAGIGSKVTGFFKRLFGQKAEAPAKTQSQQGSRPKNSTRNS